MGRTPERPGHSGRSPKARGAAAAPRAVTLGAGMRSLQRAAGNQAMGRLLARDTKPAQKTADAKPAAPAFKLILVDDGKTGIGDDLVQAAIGLVSAEMGRITKDSTDDSVKAAWDISHVKSKPTRNDDFTTALGRMTFLMFLTEGKDAKHAVKLADEYLFLDEADEQKIEKRFKKGIVAEGGVDVQVPNARRRDSQSVGFVGTVWPQTELKKSGGGAASAAAVLGDVILHELGHSLGHVEEMGTMDHDEKGIMKATVVLDAQPYKSNQFSSASAKIIRDRLEELAKANRRRGKW